jgi:hypothetical protein
MISMETARMLKDAGLNWLPAMHDFFAIPERGLDHLIFVISDMTITVEMFGQYPVVTFNGASEWALDYVTVKEVVWLPREDQLRMAVENLIHTHKNAYFELFGNAPHYKCKIVMGDVEKVFQAEDVAEVYAKVLINLLPEIRNGNILKG